MSRQEIKQRLSNYGMFMGYSLIGMAGLAFFSFYIITSRQARKLNLSEEVKSKLPFININWKKVVGFGSVAVALYGYGFYRIMKNLPETDTDRQKGDYAVLTDVNRFSPHMQEKHIFSTMQFFKVSPHLIEKTRKQLKDMDPDFQKRAALEDSKIDAGFISALTSKFQDMIGLKRTE